MDTDTQVPHTPPDQNDPPKKTLLSRFTPKQQDFLRGKNAVSNSATVLVLIVYALLLLSRLIDAAFLSRESQYLSIILLQLMIFPIPAYLYVRLKPADYVKALRFGKIRLSHLFLLLSASFVLIAGCTLLGMLCGMMTAGRCKGSASKSAPAAGRAPYSA